MKRIPKNINNTIDLTGSTLTEAVKYQHIFSAFVEKWRKEDPLIKKYPVLKTR